MRAILLVLLTCLVSVGCASSPVPPATSPPPTRAPFIVHTPTRPGSSPEGLTTETGTMTPESPTASPTRTITPSPTLMASTLRPTPVPLVTPSSARVELQLLGQIGGSIGDVVAQGNYVYLGLGPRLVTVDVSNPRQLRIVGASPVLPGLVNQIALADNYAFVLDGERGIRVLDLANARQPHEVAFIHTQNQVNALVLRQNLAYVTEGECGRVCNGILSVIDISNLRAASYLGSIELPALGEHVAVAGNYAYVGHRYGMKIFDVNSPTQLREVGSFAAAEGVYDVTIAGGYAYLGSNLSFKVVDISDPSAPRQVADSGILGGSVGRIIVREDVAFATWMYCDVGVCFGGLAPVNVHNPLHPRRAQGGFGISTVANGFAIANGYIYLADGNSTLHVMELRRAADPVLVGELHTAGHIGDIQISDRTAYVINGAHRLAFVSVKDSARPSQFGAVELGSSGGERSSTSGLAVSNGYAYVAMWEDGLHVVSVADPARPRVVAHLPVPAGIYGGAIANRKLYLTSDQGLQIVDIHDPRLPRLVGSFGLDATGSALGLSGHYAYLGSHASGSLERGHLRIIDVADPSHPREVGSIKLSQPIHSIVVERARAFITTAGCDHYPCSGGLSVIDVSDPTQPRELVALELPGGAFGIAIADRRAYVSDGEGRLWVLDTLDPAAPRALCSFQMPQRASRVIGAGETLYAAAGDAGLLVIKVK